MKERIDMNKEVLDFINAMIAAAPEVADKLMTDNIKAYLQCLAEGKSNEKPIITDNGKLILKYMQDSTSSMLKAKDIGEGLFVSSRHVAGSIRKLVTDGFVLKVGENPAVYMLTEKGKEFIIEENNEGEN